jgi:hypothetical protein
MRSPQPSSRSPQVTALPMLPRGGQFFLYSRPCRHSPGDMWTRSRDKAAELPGGLRDDGGRFSPARIPRARAACRSPSSRRRDAQPATPGRCAAASAALAGSPKRRASAPARRASMMRGSVSLPRRPRLSANRRGPRVARPEVRESNASRSNKGTLVLHDGSLVLSVRHAGALIAACQ